MAGEECFEVETVETVEGNCRACREKLELDSKGDMEESTKKNEETVGAERKEKGGKK